MLIVFTGLVIAVGLCGRQYSACQREAAVVEELRLIGAKVNVVPKSNSFLDQQFFGTLSLPAYHVELEFDDWRAQLDLLRQLTHVHKLEGTPQEDDLSEFAFLTELRTLEIYCWYTKSLRGIESLEKLEELSLSDSDAIENLDPLTGLENLKTIYTSWEDAGDLCVSSEVIASLKNLQQFDVKGCELESVAAFSNLANLEKISIEFTWGQMTGIENLVGVPALREVSLPNAGDLGNLDCFSQMPNLEKLLLFECNSLKKVEGIMNLKNLQELYLLNCHPDIDETPLEQLKTLTRKKVTVSDLGQ